MKKLTVIFLSIVLIVSFMVTPVFATGNGGTAAVTNAAGKPGETVILTLTLADFAEADTVGIEVVSDDGLTLNTRYSEWLLEGGVLSDISKNAAVWAADDAANINGDVIELAFTIPAANQAKPVYELSFNIQLKNGSTEVGAATAKATIAITVPVTDLTLSKDILEIDIANTNTADLTATVTPASAAGALIWNTSDASVATFADGKVTAKKVGSATITATVGELSRSCVVMVFCSHGQNAEGIHCDICNGIIYKNVESVTMYRLYNPNSGEHFYTGSAEERDILDAAGWDYEGIAWNAPKTMGNPIYRLYNPNNGDHHYSGSAEERDMLVSVGWQYEGVAWNTLSGIHPQYRMFNPNADCGSHHYTGSADERDFLVSLGWHYEGVGWYGLP